MPIERSAPRAPNPATRVDFSADAELVLAALGRMETAIRSERVALDRLQITLGEMAAAIAQAKSAVQSSAIKPDAATEAKAIDVAALLDELEHRVDAMLEIAGGSIAVAEADIASPHDAAPSPAAIEPAPSDVAPEHVEARSEPGDAYHLYSGGGDNPFADDQSEPTSQAPENDRVPTVSGVVSRLSRSHDALAPDLDIADDLHATGAQDDDVPTVSMLGAMVEALSASAPEALAVPPLPAPEPQAGDVAPQAEEPAAEVMTTPGASVPAEPEASVSAPEVPIMQEIDLLSRFAQMEHFPMLPPEVGMAVIFTRADGSASVPVDTTESDAMPESDAAAPQPESEPASSAPQPPEPPRATEPSSELPAVELLATPPDLEQAAAPQQPELDDIAHQRIEPAVAAELPPEAMPAVEPQEPPPDFALVAPASEPEASAPAAPVEASPAIEPETPAALEQASATVTEVPPANAASADESAAVAAEPASATAPPATEADFDPAEFLFGANSERELAGFLQQSALEPAPEPAPIAAATPPQDLALSPLEPPPAEQPEPSPAVEQPAEAPAPVPVSEYGQPTQPAPVAAPHDPLAPLKSMSAEERIALFS